MSPSTRRRLLSSVSGVGLGLLAGCLEAIGTSPDRSDSTPPASPSQPTASDAEQSPSTSDAGGFRSRTGKPSEGVFSGLSMDGLRSTCLEPSFASHAVTPVPYPTPATPADADAAVKLATSIEAAYLENWVVKNHDPLTATATNTPATPIPHDVTYPEIVADYRRASVIQRTDDGFVVQLQYERVVAGDAETRVTVNYYLTADAVTRAQADGYQKPGPHPTEDGVKLDCW